MKDIVERYYSYDGLIDTFEVESILSESDDDYQGDSYYLLRDGDRYGILIFGWGSCSGCDALEAAEGSLEEMTELRNNLWDSVRWGSREEILNYLQTEDSKLYWYGREGTYGVFKRRAIEYLE